MNLNPDMFVLPTEEFPEIFQLPQNKSALYLPLDDGQIHIIDNELMSCLKLIKSGRKPEEIFTDSEINKLKDLSILVSNRQKPHTSQNPYVPTVIFIMQSTLCNLRCIYCYANSGTIRRVVLKKEAAFCAIDFAVENATICEDDEVTVVMHGGGEPFVKENRELMAQCVEYLKERCSAVGIRPVLHAVTNGVIDKKYLDWIIQNFDRLNISLDGYKEIQDKQRPLANGGSSYEYVLNTIKTLESEGFEYTIRSTITPESVTYLEDIIDHFMSISSNKEFHFEPMLECGRCSTSGCTAPDPEIFLKHALKASRIANREGRKFVCSATDFGKSIGHFCGALGRNFAITPEGHISTCTGVTNSFNSLTDIFWIGKYDNFSGKLIFDPEKISALNERSISKLPYCRNCFAQYDCLGDCPKKVVATSGDMFDTSKNPKCRINRGLLLSRISERYDKEMRAIK